MHLLIAEDNPTNAKVVRKILTSLNHSVVLAEDGLVALEILKNEGPFDAVLMDIQMPNLDGYETTRRMLAECDNAPPIIALTANTFDSDRKMALEAGMSGFISKPITKAALESALCGFGLSAGNQSDDLGIDWEFFEMVMDDRDEESMEIFNDFCDSIPVTLKAMTLAIDQEDWSNFADLAHQVKGTLATFGLSRLSEKVGSLEQSARNGAFELPENWSLGIAEEFRLAEAKMRDCL